MLHGLSLYSVIREGGRLLVKLVSAGEKRTEKVFASLLVTELWPSYLLCSCIRAYWEMGQRHRHDKKISEAYILWAELQQDLKKLGLSCTGCIPVQSLGHKGPCISAYCCNWSLDFKIFVWVVQPTWPAGHMKTVCMCNKYLPCVSGVTKKEDARTELWTGLCDVSHTNHRPHVVYYTSLLIDP